MIFNALITALSNKRFHESKITFEAGKTSPYRFASTSKFRQRQLRTNIFQLINLLKSDQHLKIKPMNWNNLLNAMTTKIAPNSKSRSNYMSKKYQERSITNRLFK